MQALPTSLYNIAQIRALEQYTITNAHLENGTLMERAGFAAFHTLKELWPAAKHIVVVAGAGNNGGDGYVLARLAHEEGFNVRVLNAALENENVPEDAARAIQRAKESGVLITPWDAEYLAMADVIVDAIFGIGLRGKVKPHYNEIIVAINAAKNPVLALDIPSGLCADTGRELGDVIRADVTMTFLAMKQGLTTGSAAEYVGEIICNDLGMADFLNEKIKPAAYRCDIQTIIEILKPRPRVANKGNFGHVLVIGGDEGYAGAASMAACAALRTGAGLVSVATRKAHIPALVAKHPEIMAHGVENADELDSLLSRATTIILGPGLGRSAWGQQLWLKAVSTHLPMVMDADGLYCLSEDPHISREWILTPHPGEAARLLKTSVEDIQYDRFAAAKELQQHYGGIAVLKGSGTIIQSEEETPYVCTAGNPGMATGGMGDILSGIIGGLIAQHIPLAIAAQIGVEIHAVAADLAAREGERGMLATDLLPYIRQLVNPRIY